MGSSFKIAIIISQFNRIIVEKLLEGAIERLAELGVQDNQIRTIWVPGAIEIPLVAQQLAKTKYYKAVVCLGSVIRGETDHYNYVCQQVSFGCQQIALEYEIPIIFGILTTANEAQAFSRAGGDRGNKGANCIDTAMAMVDIMEKI